MSQRADRHARGRADQHHRGRQPALVAHRDRRSACWSARCSWRSTRRRGRSSGLPQMIQSRPQFGYLGALLVWLFAYLQYAGFNVFNSDPGRRGACTPRSHGSDQALDRRRHGRRRSSSRSSATTSSTRPSSTSTYAMLVIFGIFTVVLFLRCTTRPAPSTSAASSATPFLAQFGVVAGYQISWAIYVSDYSRYLPAGRHRAQDVLLDLLGLGASAARWLMCVGALLAAWAGATTSTAPASPRSMQAGDKVFDGFGDDRADPRPRSGLVSVMALNMYGGSLTLISAIDSFKRVRPTLDVRLVTDRAHRGALASSGRWPPRQLPGQLQQLPAAGPLLVHPVDGGEPGRLLHRAPRPLRDRRDLQARRHLRPVGLAGHPGLPRRLRRDGPVLRGRHACSPARSPSTRCTARTSRSSSGCRWRACSTTCFAGPSTSRPRRGSRRPRRTTWRQAAADAPV